MLLSPAAWGRRRDYLLKAAFGVKSNAVTAILGFSGKIIDITLPVGYNKEIAKVSAVSAKQSFR